MMKSALRNMLILSAVVLMPTTAQAATAITSTTETAYNATFNPAAFTARAAVSRSGGRNYSLTNSFTNGDLTNGTSLFTNGGTTRAFSLTYDPLSGLTNFSLNGESGASVTASQLAGFSDLGFRLRADATTSVITLSNLFLNKAALVGSPISSTGGTSYFSLSQLSASDFANGFSLAGDITMTYVGSPSGSSIEARIHGAGPVGAVPEPATWAMMLLGFGMVGFTLRRRKRTTANFSFA